MNWRWNYAWNFDIRKNILKLSEKEDIIKYKEYVYDRTTFKNHWKTVLLMKDKERKVQRYDE